MTAPTQTFEEYLAELPPERRTEVEQVWQAVRANMPAGYVENIGPKFLSFTSDGEQYVALANQKNYISLYVVPLYTFPSMKAKLDASEKRVKSGKSCINFKRADELPLDVIGEIVAATEADAFVAHVRDVRANHSAYRAKQKAS